MRRRIIRFDFRTLAPVKRWLFVRDLDKMVVLRASECAVRRFVLVLALTSSVCRGECVAEVEVGRFEMKQNSNDELSFAVVALSLFYGGYGVLLEKNASECWIS